MDKTPKDNIIPFRLKGAPGTGKEAVGNQMPPSGPPKLPQDQYSFTTVNPYTGEEITREKTGHLVVTQQNIVLFNENQEMIWGIPNNDSLIEFERLSGFYDTSSVELLPEEFFDDEATEEDLDSGPESN